MKKFFGEFKEFVMRGNVMDLAVAVIIGAAFGAIVTALCEKIITPLIQLIMGTIFGKGIDEMTTVLNVGPIEFGAFASAVINFLIMALIIFILVKAVNKAMTIGKKKEEEPEAEPTTKVCPYCKREIDIEATRCPHCTSQLDE